VGRGRQFLLVALVAASAACSRAPDRATATSTTGAAVAPTTTAPVSTSTTAASPTTTSTTTAPTTVPATTTVAPVDRPELPAEPGALADALVAAERAVRDPATPEADAVHAGHVQQVVYRFLGVHPEWDAAVFARVPADLQSAVQLNLDARRAFRSMSTVVSDTLPAWEIVTPAPAADLLAWYHEAEQATGVAWEYLAAINLVETAMGRIHGLSSAGAQGPMQFLPSTWAAFGSGNIDDPHDAILGAARYLAHNGLAAGNVDGALYRYNNDNRYVRGVEAFAEVMAGDAGAFTGYYNWQVYYSTTMGDVLLPVGYVSPVRVPVADYFAAHP
jgi:membrane-bound lytic murein transglycosylase B